MIIDTHAHLMFPEFKDDLEEVLKRASSVSVKKIVNVGCSVEACRQGLEMLGKYDDPDGKKGVGVELFATLGLHPYDVLDLTDEVLEEWREAIKIYGKKIVAVGEIGLDYFKAKISKEDQQNAFRKQLLFASETKLPVIVHNREADEDSLKILKEFPDLKVVFHCYGSTQEFAREVWAAGYFTSFTGIITYPNASNLREVVKECPLDRWMVETDCPYLAPQEFRGKRNEPSYVVEVLKKVAEVKGLEAGKCEKLQEENVRNFYGI